MKNRIDWYINFVLKKVCGCRADYFEWCLPYRRNLPVETVKELMMSEDDKKIPEEKDGERTDTSVKTESSVPLTEAQKSPAQKQRNRTGR